MLVAQEDEIPTERRPYRVEINVAFEPHFRSTATFQRETLREISTAVDNATGVLWDLTLKSVNDIKPANSLGLSRLTEVSLKEVPPGDNPPDKRFFLTVSIEGLHYHVATREWDELSQKLSPIESASTLKRRAIGNSALKVITRSFHPLYDIVGADLDTDNIMLVLRAGALTPPGTANDPHADLLRVQARPGDVLIPFFKYYNRDGSFRQNQTFSWTYVQIDSIEKGRVVGRRVSAFRVPLGAQRSRRVKQHAITMNAHFDATQLQLQLRRNQQRKLGAHFVTVARDKSLKDPEVILGQSYTDRQGFTPLQTRADQRIVWLHVRSGNSLLARVPYAPGGSYSESLDLPDDSMRLGVEGDVAQLKGELVDTVAKRAATMIRAKSMAKLKRWGQVDILLKKLDALPQKQDFLNDIKAIREPALVAAANEKNRAAGRKIQQLCSDVTDLVNTYMASEKLKEMRIEIEEMRKAQ